MEALLELFDKKITLKRSAFLSVEGNIDTNLYHVESGSLQIYLLDDDQEKIIRFGYRGNFIVLLDSFLTGRPTQFFVQAIKKTVVKVIPKSRLDSFLNTTNSSTEWTHILENLAMQQLEREIDILTNSPKERYERVLKRSPQLFQEIPQKHIANYLRMSPETLSRLKNLDLNQV
jgi:CRP-like cAMP-binding protein